MPKKRTAQLVLPHPMHGGGLWLAAKTQLHRAGHSAAELAQFDAECQQNPDDVRSVVDRWVRVYEPFRNPKLRAAALAARKKAATPDSPPDTDSSAGAGDAPEEPDATGS